MRKFFLPLAGVTALVFTLTLIAFFRTASEARPTGETGETAVKLDQKIQKAIGYEQWRKIAAIEFVSNSTGARHWIDMKRSLWEVTYTEKTDTFRVQTNEISNRSIALENDKPVSEKRADEVIAQARQYHQHALFWLQPFDLFYRKKAVMTKIGDQAILYTFPDGDGKPGDAYMIVTDRNGNPTHMKVWSEGMPFQGIESSMDEWTTLPGGARISLSRETFLQKISYKVVEVYSKYPESGAEDRFAELLQ